MTGSTAVTELLQPQRTGIPLPTPTPVSAPFWAGCADGELRYQRCAACGEAAFDPAWACRACGSGRLEWQVGAGLGVVATHTVVHRPQSPAFTVPYAVVIVAFDEGYRMLTNLIGCRPDDVRTGLRVRVTFHDVGGGFRLPYVEPVTRDEGGAIDG